MSIRKDAAASDSRNITVSRVEWLLLLKDVPQQADPIVNQMVVDLKLGSMNTKADEVMLERWQVVEVLKLVPTEQVQEVIEQP